MSSETSKPAASQPRNVPRFPRLFCWFNIRPGEERPTSLMLLHSFSMGISTVFFETAASALFLSRFEAGLVPYVYLAAAAVSILTGLTYTRLKDRLAFAPLMTGTLVALLLMVCLTRLGLTAFAAGWLVFSMMIAYRLLSILTDLEYWAVAARLYDVGQSKRLFSFIGSGEVGARILGAFSVPLLVPLLGVPNLLWISAAGLGASILVLGALVHAHPEIRSRAPETGAEARRRQSRPSLRPVLASPYLRLIFALALFAVLGKYFVDFAFLTQMQTRWQAVENLASFFGLFSGVSQAINLLIRIFVSGRLLSRFGIGVGLVVLPVAHFLCTLGIVAAASVPAVVFWLVISNQGLYKTLSHPIDRPSFKILYQPLPRRERLTAQIVVEVLVTPLAIALAAVLMIALAGAAASVVALAYVMVAVFIAWSIAAVLAFRQYGPALVRALEKRSLDRGSFAIEDEKSIALLRTKLASDYPEDVVFALDLLQRTDASSVERHWNRLLDHASSDVRRYVLLQIEKTRPESLCAAVGKLVREEKDARVLAAALRALAALGDPENQVARYLGSGDRTVERGALVGLLRGEGSSGGAEQARRRLADLAASHEPVDRALACRVLGETDEPPMALGPLLRDENERVRRKALRAAGRRGDPALLRRVLTQLEEPHYRADAARALLVAGTASASLLAETLTDDGLSCHARAHMARIAARLPDFDTEALWRAYESDCEPLRQEALRALSAQGYRGGDDEPEKLQVITRHIACEVEKALWQLACLRDLGKAPGLETVVSSLRDELEQSRERLLFLLSFVYDRQAILSVKDHLGSTSKEKRAYAAEILDVTLPQDLKELTLPLLESTSLESRIAQLRGRVQEPRRSETDRLRELLRSDGRIGHWTKACAIYSARKVAARDIDGELRHLAAENDSLIAETSRWALEGNENPRSHSMLTIEKIMLLRGVAMFASTSEDVLQDVATILEEIELAPGERVFDKGDRGDSMYIIVHGRARVFDGDKTINFLGEREIFGELALLDPEPRSASVEAVEETLVFRLNRNTLFELMADNVGVVSGIMQVLCRRLRRMTAIATGDQ